MATATSSPVESPVVPVQEYVTELPDGMTLESLTKSPPADQRPGHFLDSSFEEVPAEPETPATEPVKVEPEKPTPVVAVEPAKPVAQPAPPGVLREREKARRYKREWQSAVDAKEEAERRLAAAQAAPPQAPQVTFTAAERVELRRLANEKDTPGDVFDFMLDTVTGRVNATLARPAPPKTFAQARADQVPLEEAFRNKLAADGINYRAVVEKAGLWKALAVSPLTGQYEDPGVVSKVIGSGNWAETLYGLAWGKLEDEGFFDDPENAATIAISGDGVPASEPRVKPSATEPAKSAAKPAAVTPATPAAEALAEAERRGARRVAEEVGHNADRGRGIRGLPSAGGPPRAAFSREGLLALMRRDYPAYQRICAKDQRINAWVTEGIPLDEP